MQLLDRVVRTIRAHELARADTRVVAAVSGGPDSTALVHLLAELADRGLLRLAGLVHLNHQLREAADADERVCGEAAARLGLPLVAHREDVRARARVERRSLEDAARRARYELYERARQDLGADAVALGHTRDDQAETFLLRLLRGAGSRGLAAMHPRTGRVIRPLLDCRRAELRAYLDARGLPYVHDESNDDVSIPRNRVRLELIPLIEQRFNPAIVDVLADEAALAREEWRWLEDTAGRAAGEIASTPKDGVWTLDAAALVRLPRAVARQVVRAALAAAAAGAPVTFRHVEDALGVAAGEAPRVDGPGARMERIGGALVITSRERRRPAEPRPNLFRYPLSVPGEVALPEAGWLVSAEAAPSAPGAELSNGATAILQLDRCRPPLAVRNRRPGDAFRPLGLGGRKKLQDYFVDRKVPRDRRDAVPLVVDERDRIVWVAGHGIDEEVRVIDPAQAVLILRLRQV